MAFSKQTANTSLYLCGVCMEIAAYVQVLNAMILKALTSLYSNLIRKSWGESVLGILCSHFNIFSWQRMFWHLTKHDRKQKKKNIEIIVGLFSLNL